MAFSVRSENGGLVKMEAERPPFKGRRLPLAALGVTRLAVTSKLHDNIVCVSVQP